MPEAEQMIELKSVGAQLFFAVITVIVTFSVVNTFMMMVFERTPEFGMLMAIGMRPVINMIQVAKVYDVLKDRDVPTDNQTWNRRYREYMNKIQTGDPIEVGKVLRDLALLRVDKNLSFGERKMYDQARGLLVQEISVAKDCDEKTVEAELDPAELAAWTVIASMILNLDETLTRD